MKLSFAALILAIFAWPCQGLSQTKTRSLNLAPRMSAWTIQYTSETKSDPKQIPSPKVRAHIIKTDDTMFIEEWRADGTSTVVWRYQGLMIIPVQGSYALRDPNFEPDMKSMFQTDFFELSWIQAKLFQGQVDKEGQQLWHFLQHADESSLSPDGTFIKTAHPEREAWLNAETGLPVMAREGGTTWTYEFLATPTSPIVLPGPVLEIVRKYAKYQNPLYIPR